MPVMKKMAKQFEDKKIWVFNIVREARFGFLATVNQDNRPCVRPMMTYLDGDAVLWAPVLPNSRTLIHIQRNPMVEICFLDRKMDSCRISGRAKINNDL